MAIFSMFDDILLNSINGVSYIGKPKSNTMMYMSKKIESKIEGLYSVHDCLVFLEDNIVVPENLGKIHTFVLCKDPAATYTEVVHRLADKVAIEYKNKKVHCTESGYYVGENVKIGDNATIEPCVFIDHDVLIGNNVIIKSGAKIRSNTKIGDNCSIGENTVIGEPAFNMAEISVGDIVRIPSFGGVKIGDNVYIGANTSISRGGADDTIIENNVKIDCNVRLGHDVHLHEAAEILGCAIVAGYCEIGAYSVIAINATLKNRTIVGEHCYVGMGSVVHHNVSDRFVISGSPAMSMEKIGRKKVLELKLKELIRKFD